MKKSHIDPFLLTLDQGIKVLPVRVSWILYPLPTLTYTPLLDLVNIIEE
jgi:hypothetical protein